MPSVNPLKTRDVSIAIAGASSIAIRPNGEFDLLENWRWVLNEADVKLFSITSDTGKINALVFRSKHTMDSQAKLTWQYFSTDLQGFSGRLF